MDIKSTIESILFIYGEPISLDSLVKATGAKADEVESALLELTKEYSQKGIRVIKNDLRWQMGTAPENSLIIEKMIKSEFTEELSKAALETLTITAYKGPLTRTEIEHIRGVNSSFTIRNLLLRGLIERLDNPKDSRSYIYQISFDTLKYLGLGSVEELPEYSDFKAKKIEIEESSTT